MKRALILIIALLMLLEGVAVYAAAETAEPQPEVKYDYEELKVGSTTPFDGKFFTQMWGNASSDLDVRLLIHGYNLVEWRSGEGRFAEDPSVVSGIVVTENEAGDRTYTLTLYGDLKYSDGSAITAKDYAFSLLLSIAPEIEALGGSTRPLEYVVGYDAYETGKTRYLRGVRLLGKNTLSITVSHKYQPFFYELGWLDCVPYPIGEIAPGCEVRDDGNGVYIANADAGAKEPVFTAELLRKTILDPETGYQTHPQVTSGPYRLVSFDGTTAKFEINENYKGNSAGEKPTIQRLEYRTVENGTMVGELKSGEITLLNKCTAKEPVQEGLALIESSDAFTMASYPRSGLGYIGFCCEQAAVSEAAVRQAISMCLDKDALAKGAVGDNGQRVDGYYGLGQWMYRLVEKDIPYPVEAPAEDADAATVAAYEAKLATWEAVSLEGVKKYELDVEGAKALLEEAGWTQNREGGAYDAAKDDVRCKEVNGKLEALELTLLCPAGNNIPGNLEETFTKNLAEAGIKLEVEVKPMAEVLEAYYRHEERSCEMIFMASNFDVVFDPSVNFKPDEEGEVNGYNTTGIADEGLYEAAVAMRQTTPGDVLEYCQKWLTFQERFQEVVPMIPVYSSEYYDFYPRELQNYAVADNITWSKAIVGAYLGDVAEVEEAAEG